MVDETNVTHEVTNETTTSLNDETPETPKKDEEDGGGDEGQITLF